MAYSKEELEYAKKVIKEAVSREHERLSRIAKTEEGDPIMLEGETETGHFCMLQVDPQPVARVMLNYEYPTWKVLDEDAPDDMWHELAGMHGLRDISSVDI